MEIYVQDQDHDTVEDQDQDIVQDQDQDNGSNLVNESKLDVEPVSDCRHPFRAASVWTHDDRIPAGFLVED